MKQGKILGRLTIVLWGAMGLGISALPVLAAETSADDLPLGPEYEESAPAAKAPAPEIKTPVPAIKASSPAVKASSTVETSADAPPLGPEFEEPDLAAKAPPPEVKATSPVTKAPASEAKTPVLENKSPVPGIKPPVSEAKVPVPEAKVPVPEAKVPAPEAKVPAPEAKVPAPEAKVPAPEAKVPVPEAKVPAPEAKVTASEIDRKPAQSRGKPIKKKNVSLSAADAVLTQGAAPLHANGKLSGKEGSTFVAQSKVVGTYGTFNIDAAGVWDYTTQTALAELKAGERVEDVFLVAGSDGSGTSVRIVINGTNDPAVLSSAEVVLVETNELLITSGKLTIKDVDSPETFIPMKKSGGYGMFFINASGAWTYATKGTLNYLQAGQSVSDTFTVSSADGTTTTVKIIIDGTNDPAILSSADVVLKETNEPLSTGGKLTIRDVDSPETFVPQNKVAGSYGTFNIDEAGVWSYVANSAFDYLNVGQSISDSFVVSSADGTTTMVKVTIEGTNDPAVLTPAYVVLQQTQTDLPLSAGGKLSIKDVDNPETFREMSEEGDYGIFNLDSAGVWSYKVTSVLDDFEAAEGVSDSFTVSSSDGTKTTVRVVINNGTDNPAVLSSADIMLLETNMPWKVQGKLTIKDEDGQESFVPQSNVFGSYGIFNIKSTGDWTYSAYSAFNYLNVGQSVGDTFLVASADGTTSTVKVTIHGTNDPAVLGSANVVLEQGSDYLTARGKLSIKDVDNPEVFIAEKKYGNYGTFNIFASGVWNYITSSELGYLKAGQKVYDDFTVTSADGTTSSVKITIVGVNDPAILSDDDVVLIQTNEPLHTGGKLTILDVDSPGTFVAQKKVGNYGTFNINENGEWTYDAKKSFDYLAAGDGISDLFTVSSADGTTTTVKITIDGINDPAILGKADVVLIETNEPLKTGGKLSIKDVDSPAAFVAQKKDGSYGTFNIDASGTWTYVTNGPLNDLKFGEGVFDIFTVSSVDGTETSVKITIDGTDDPAILGAADVVLEETDEPLKASGTLTIKDVDSPETFVEQNNFAGNIGTFSITANGVWSFVAKTAFDELNVGQSVSEKYTVSSVDGTETTVKITINGTNDPAILGSADEVLVEANEPLVASGALSIKDVDSPETFGVQRDVAGMYGVFNIAVSGAWTYRTNDALDYLNVGQSVSDSFRVFSADGTGTTVKITVDGTNDPAILGAADVELTETNVPLKVGGTLTISDVDSPQTFIPQKLTAGSYGVFNIDSSGNWTYATNSALDFLMEGQDVSDKFIVTSADGTTTTVKVTIHGTNDPAVLGAADVVLKQSNVPLKTSGKLRIKDVDSPAVFIAQENVAGSNGVFSIDASGNWTYVANSAFTNLKPGQSLGDIFSVSSADGTMTTVRVRINGNPEMRK